MTRLAACTAIFALMLGATAPVAQSVSGAQSASGGTEAGTQPGAPAAADGTGALSNASDEILVRVDITSVSSQLATSLHVGVDALPRSVEMPVDLAAALCELGEEQLLQARMVEANVECNATTTSKELAEATRAQMVRDQEGKAGN